MFATLVGAVAFAGATAQHLFRIKPLNLFYEETIIVVWKWEVLAILLILQYTHLRQSIFRNTQQRTDNWDWELTTNSLLNWILVSLFIRIDIIIPNNEIIVCVSRNACTENACTRATKNACTNIVLLLRRGLSIVTCYPLHEFVLTGGLLHCCTVALLHEFVPTPAPCVSKEENILLPHP